MTYNMFLCFCLQKIFLKDFMRYSIRYRSDKIWLFSLCVSEILAELKHALNLFLNCFSLEGKRERGASQQPTPADPYFFTPSAPNRLYTLH